MLSTNMVVPPLLVFELCSFDHFTNSYTHHNSVTEIYVFMKFIGMCNTSRKSVAHNYDCFPFFVSELWRFDHFCFSF